MKKRLTRFLEQTSKHNFDDLWLWSQKNPLDFWRALWDGCSVIGSKGNSDFFNSSEFPYTFWYPDARINYAENILHTRDESVAIISCDNNGNSQAITRARLYAEVSRDFYTLKSLKIKPGDVVVGILPPGLAAITLLLAVAAHGAVWCGLDVPKSADFALSASSNASTNFAKDNIAIARILHKLIQINPQLIICDSGKNNLSNQQFSLLLSKIKTELPNSILIPFVINDNELQQSFATDWKTIQQQQKVKTIDFYPCPFSQPLLYQLSEGVAGKAKIFCHTHGSIVLQHFKEQQLECELDNNDTFLYLTRIDQLMWLWSVSLIAQQVRLVVGDFPNKISENSPLLEVISEEKVTHLGVYSQYIQSFALQQLGDRQTALRSLICTAAPLRFDSVKQIKANLPGVEIINLYATSETMACFAMSKIIHQENDTDEYYDPTLLRPCLGIVIERYYSLDNIDNDFDLGRTNLLCSLPFPGLPFALLHDLDNQIYWQNYYQAYPGKWSLNDVLQWQTEDSFACLGSKVNTANIKYFVQEDIRLLVENEEEVSGCFFICREMLAANSSEFSNTDNYASSWVFFIQIKNQYRVNHQLQEKITTNLRNIFPINPDYVIPVAELPYSRSGKIMAYTAAKLVAGGKANEINFEDVINPEDLGYFRNIYQLKDWPNLANKRN